MYTILCGIGVIKSAIKSDVHMYIVHVSRMPKSSNVTGKTTAIKSTIYGCQQNLLTI